jgi:hypothetical protein
MSLVVAEGKTSTAALPVPHTARNDYAARPALVSWPATRQGHGEVLARLASTYADTATMPRSLPVWLDSRMSPGCASA